MYNVSDQTNITRIVGEGFQLKLSSKNLASLQKKCNELNIPFEEVFVRDWRHFPLQCFLGEDYDNKNLLHEGIAYEHEDFWDMYYQDGLLEKLPELRDNNFLIQKIYKKDIINVDNDIEFLFEKWVKENIDRVCK